jgi:hypothetical protein
LKSLSVQCSIRRADALLVRRSRSRVASRPSARRPTRSASGCLQAKAHFVKAEAMRLANDQNATRGRAGAAYLNDIKAEDGSQKRSSARMSAR